MSKTADSGIDEQQRQANSGIVLCFQLLRTIVEIYDADGPMVPVDTVAVYGQDREPFDIAIEKARDYVNTIDSTTQVGSIGSE